MSSVKKKAGSSKSDFTAKKKTFLADFENRKSGLKDAENDYHESLLKFYRAQKNSYFDLPVTDDPIYFNATTNNPIRARIYLYNDPLPVKQIAFRCEVKWLGDATGGGIFIKSGATNPGGPLQTPSEWISLYAKGEVPIKALIIEFRLTVSVLTTANRIVTYSQANVDPFFWFGNPKKSGITTLPIILSPPYGSGIFLELEGNFNIPAPK